MLIDLKIPNQQNIFCDQAHYDTDSKNPIIIESGHLLLTCFREGFKLETWKHFKFEGSYVNCPLHVKFVLSLCFHIESVSLEIIKLIFCWRQKQWTICLTRSFIPFLFTGTFIVHVCLRAKKAYYYQILCLPITVLPSRALWLLHSYPQCGL